IFDKNFLEPINKLNEFGKRVRETIVKSEKRAAKPAKRVATEAPTAPLERPPPAPEKPAEKKVPKAEEVTKSEEEPIEIMSNEQEAEQDLNRLLGELEKWKQALINTAKTEPKRAKIEEALKAYMSEWNSQKSQVSEALGKIKSTEKYTKYSERCEQVDGDKVKEEVGKILEGKEREANGKKKKPGPFDNAVSILLFIGISVIILPFLINVAKAGIRGGGLVKPGASLWDRILSNALTYQYYNYIGIAVIAVGAIVTIWYILDFLRDFRRWREEEDPEGRKWASLGEFAIMYHLLVAKSLWTLFLTIVGMRKVTVIKDRKQLDSILDSPFYYLDNNVYFIPDGKVIYRGPEGSCKWEGPVLWSHGKVLRGKEYLSVGWRTDKVIEHLKKKYGIDRKPFVVTCKNLYPNYSIIQSENGVLSVLQPAKTKFYIDKIPRGDTSVLRKDLSSDDKEAAMLEFGYLLTELQNYSKRREEIPTSPPYHAIQEWQRKNLPKDARMTVDVDFQYKLSGIGLTILVIVNDRALAGLYSRKVLGIVEKWIRRLRYLKILIRTILSFGKAKPSEKELDKIDRTLAKKETAFQIFGDRINPSKQKELQDAIVTRDAKEIKDYARKQIKRGARWLDIGAANIPDRGPDEECKDLAWVVETVQLVTNTPIILDSAHPPAIEAALEVCRPDIPVMINSINEESLESILSILKKHKNRIISVIVMPLPGQYTFEEKLKSLKKVLIRLEGIINPENIFIDPAVVPLFTTDQAGESVKAGISVLETIKNIKTLPEFKRMKTTAGFRN
nr:dihydropteroate synthase [Nanoarchaeota archaeon]